MFRRATLLVLAIAILLSFSTFSTIAAAQGAKVEDQGQNPWRSAFSSKGGKLSLAELVAGSVAGGALAITISATTLKELKNEHSDDTIPVAIAVGIMWVGLAGGEIYKWYKNYIRPGEVKQTSWPVHPYWYKRRTGTYTYPSFSLR